MGELMGCDGEYQHGGNEVVNQKWWGHQPMGARADSVVLFFLISFSFLSSFIDFNSQIVFEALTSNDTCKLTTYSYSIYIQT